MEERKPYQHSPKHKGFDNKSELAFLEATEYIELIREIDNDMVELRIRHKRVVKIDDEENEI